MSGLTFPKAGTAEVTMDVSVAFFEPQHLENVEPRVHTGNHCEFPRRPTLKRVGLERLCIRLIIPEEQVSLRHWNSTVSRLRGSSYLVNIGVPKPATKEKTGKVQRVFVSFQCW